MPRGSKHLQVTASWTFTLWLTFQQRRTDAVGELARRVAADEAWPAHRDCAGLHTYLTEHGATPDTLDALSQAWEEWQAVRTLARTPDFGGL